jgi:hypothetical protein
VRLLDLVYLLEKREIDWPQLLSRLEQAGVKTCGWIPLTWLEMLTGMTAGEEVMRTHRLWGVVRTLPTCFCSQGTERPLEN